MVDERHRERLSQLSLYLDDSEWLDRDFSAGDLLMVHAAMVTGVGIAEGISEPLRLCRP